MIATDTRTLLVRQTPHSFVREIDYTMSPYSGCAFQCGGGMGGGRIYCYVPDLLYGRAERLGGWGNYVELRARAADVLAASAAKLSGATLFMSATTDPYQPVEAKHRITRALLETILTQKLEMRWLLISTRSPLVLRDLDLFQDLAGRIEIGISVPSDREDVRRAVDPRNPPVKRRLDALRRLRGAGVPVRLQVSPMMPSSGDFPRLAGDAADWTWVDWLAHGRAGGRSLFESLGWGDWQRPERVKLEAESWLSTLGAHRLGTGRSWFAARWDGNRAVRWLAEKEATDDVARTSRVA